ncbi:MAG TPA: glycosyltransferase family 39 protein [Chthoniobacterales bacterium]|nr:glycosyltransferase family 39 protein [Chthoniobacterales bacterium]
MLPLFGFVLAVNFAAMPAEEYPGDASAVRLEAISLINSRQWAVPPDIVALAGARGQYFYQNAKGAWYPKYGILNTLIYVPPLWFQKVVSGRLTFESDNTFCLNLFNLVLTGISATYLVLLARRYTKSMAVVWAFVIASFYSTFWWNYLRAQTFETYVTLFMLAFYYHFVSAWNCERPTQRNRQLLIAAIYLGFLCLCKMVYVILLPAVIVFFALSKRPRFRSEPVTTERDKLASQLLFFWLPLSIFVCILLAANWYKFGSPLNTGYLQWERETQPFTANLVPALRGFIFSKQWSIFLHFPVLLFALIGWPIFFKKYKSEAMLVAGLGTVLLLANSAFTNWKGEACYGPRYLLPVLPLLSLPFLQAAGWMSALPSKIMKGLIYAMVVSSLTYSFLLQVGVNSLPFLFWYDLYALPENRTSSPAFDYLRSHHFGTINIDFIRYAAGRPSRFHCDYVARLEPSEFVSLEGLKAETRCNYYWFPNPVEPMQ